jgi:hypothetical protein
MAQPLSQDMLSARRPAARAILLWGTVATTTIVLLATLVLWVHYGTAVFFEMIAAGFAACF